MNELFVNIKVDREERPDIDKIYQFAHQVLTQFGVPLEKVHLVLLNGTYLNARARDESVIKAGDALAAGTASIAAGGTAVIWSALIPMWAAYKTITLGLGLPGLVPGNDGFDGAPSSETTVAQMRWAYVGINDAINHDFDYCWQWLGSAPLTELLPDGFDQANLLLNLPAGA